MIISEMQRKLPTWAAGDPSRRIKHLLSLIIQPEWLAEAARITLASKGAHTDFYRGVSVYEDALNPIVQDLLDAICQNLGGPSKPRIRESSYLLLSVYKHGDSHAYREFLQDPYEDDHLLTFIKPTSPGLMLFTHEGLIPTAPAANEMVVLAGSLLEVLTDDEVKAMHHAVKQASDPVIRKSLIYFVNPNFSTKRTTSLLHNQQIDLANLADRHHVGFSNNRLNPAIPYLIPRSTGKGKIGRKYRLCSPLHSSCTEPILFANRTQGL